MNVALIDDGVEINNITNKYVYEFLEIKDISIGFEKQTTNINSYSHGTICASIIRKMSKSAKIYSLKILETNSLCASTDKLEKAFEWCLKNDIDIINMSLGTINSRDFIVIKRWIRRLFNSRKIIIAAINNDNTYTLPASLPEAIGVSSEEKLCDFKFINDSIIGIDILACSNYCIELNNEKSTITPFCNSFATPAVTGKICEVMNKDYNSMEERDKYFAINIKEKLYMKYKNLELDSIDNMVKYEFNQKYLFRSIFSWKNNVIKKVPIISIECSQIDLSKFNKLFYNDNIFPVAVCGEYILNKMKKRFIYSILNRISGLMDCDLIILYNITKGFLHEDLFIEYCSIGFKLSYRNRFKKVERNYQEIEAVYKKMLKLLE